MHEEVEHRPTADILADVERLNGEIAVGGLNATQLEFLTMVIDELTRRGEMQPSRLYQSPYEDRAATRIDLVFPVESEADAMITVLHDIERAATPIRSTSERSPA